MCSCRQGAHRRRRQWRSEEARDPWEQPTLNSVASSGHLGSAFSHLLPPVIPRLHLGGGVGPVIVNMLCIGKRGTERLTDLPRVIQLAAELAFEAEHPGSQACALHPSTALHDWELAG